MTYVLYIQEICLLRICSLFFSTIQEKNGNFSFSLFFELFTISFFYTVVSFTYDTNISLSSSHNFRYYYYYHLGFVVGLRLVMLESTNSVRSKRTARAENLVVRKNPRTHVIHEPRVGSMQNTVMQTPKPSDSHHRSPRSTTVVQASSWWLLVLKISFLGYGLSESLTVSVETMELIDDRNNWCDLCSLCHEYSSARCFSLSFTLIGSKKILFKWVPFYTVSRYWHRLTFDWNENLIRSDIACRFSRERTIINSAVLCVICRASLVDESYIWVSILESLIGYFFCWIALLKPQPASKQYKAGRQSASVYETQPYDLS